MVNIISDTLLKKAKQRDVLNKMYRADEAECLNALIQSLDFSADKKRAIANTAREFITTVRKEDQDKTAIEKFMLHYDLATEEGVLLMCLAEALLRIPDAETKDKLIEDKLTSAAWGKHIGESESAIVNMATWGLALSGKVLKSEQDGNVFKNIWQKLLNRSSEPVIRKAVRTAMGILSQHFVLGRTIEEALDNSKEMASEGYNYSYDMLGEVARTQKDADHYFQAYFDAISALGKQESASRDCYVAGAPRNDVYKRSGISIKLSALHPRYEYTQREKVVPILIERVGQLVIHAKKMHVAVTIDAEEADRLDMSLDIIEGVFCLTELTGWDGLGLALQAYQKRAFYLIDYLIDLSRREGKRLHVRLVKGAYWDSEVKVSQVEGFSDYPVFTRKVNTDVSYIACAKKLLSAQDAIYPQFATHNAYSIAAILSLLGDKPQEFQLEFQSLQGMGRALHNQLVQAEYHHLPCRIYAPVGSHEDLLPYLVRRLLENGANSSFVNRIADKDVSIDDLIQSPLARAQKNKLACNPYIPLPKDVYKTRQNSTGLDLSSLQNIQELTNSFQKIQKNKTSEIKVASVNDVENAIAQAKHGFKIWRKQSVDYRASILENMAALMEKHRDELIHLAVFEAGKTLHDAISEVREAVDFCRYYAEQARLHLTDQVMPGPTGESNILKMEGRGVFLCISPWNFPLAIFIGQVSAALVAGNSVIAKPAEQTPLIAARAVALFHQAGCEKNVLQLMPGEGETLGAALVNNPGIEGVIFTGSNQTAKAIQKTLANRDGAIIPLIAETGGINAMIADSSALPEQLVRDVVQSAFGSCGQRCSALRVLLVQEDIVEPVIAMLQGAMAELVVGNPLHLQTDIGPVIDEEARSMLQNHVDELEKTAELIYRVALPDEAQSGTFLAPQAFRLKSIRELKQESFGPILHVVSFAQDKLDEVIDDINSLGFGLTFGVQSRIEKTVRYIEDNIRVGNVYVNRNMIGAVVGVQPFGGCGLSGTGPKAGGPHYLFRLCHEKTISVDTTAAGGNASLMAMDDG